MPNNIKACQQPGRRNRPMTVGFEILGSSTAKFNVAMKQRLDLLRTN